MVGNVREYVQELRAPTPEQVQAFARLLSPAPTAAESWVATRGGSFDRPLPKEAGARHHAGAESLRGEQYRVPVREGRELNRRSPSPD